MMEHLLKALDSIAKKAAQIAFYKAQKSKTDLFYLYGVQAFAYASKHYCHLPYPRFKKKYDGNDWCYFGNMETGQYHRIGIGTQQNFNLGSRGHCSHTAYNSIPGIAFRAVMPDNYINVCEDILFSSVSNDIASVAGAIQDGYIAKQKDGGFFITVPYFTKSQKKEFDAIADQYLSPLMPQYSEIVHTFIAGYKKLFTKHLHDDADRMCQGMFVGLYSKIVEYAQKTGVVQMPSVPCYCDVMIQQE
ncbi:MAG: hypothetical protein HFE77_02595 [Clostridiales bacterium]|nr:hypothetical protein [Clostridiales bacterium]